VKLRLPRDKQQGNCTHTCILMSSTLLGVSFSYEKGNPVVRVCGPTVTFLTCPRCMYVVARLLICNIWNFQWKLSRTFAPWGAGRKHDKMITVVISCIFLSLREAPEKVTKTQKYDKVTIFSRT
jgi:hypothetical protein